MTIDEEVEHLISTINRMANPITAVFAPDPQKIRDYKIAHRRMWERRSGTNAIRT